MNKDVSKLLKKAQDSALEAGEKVALIKKLGKKLPVGTCYIAPSWKGDEVRVTTKTKDYKSLGKILARYDRIPMVFTKGATMGYRTESTDNCIEIGDLFVEREEYVREVRYTDYLKGHAEAMTREDILRVEDSVKFYTMIGKYKVLFNIELDHKLDLEKFFDAKFHRIRFYTATKTRKNYKYYQLREECSNENKSS